MKIFSYLLFSVGFMLLAASLYLYLYALTFDLDWPSETEKFSLSTAEVQFNCERKKPTPLFLNIYADTKAPWIAVLFGREKDVALTFIHPLRSKEDSNFAPFVVTNEGLKRPDELNGAERKELRQNFIFTADEIKFLELCIAKADGPKYQI